MISDLFSASKSASSRKKLGSKIPGFYLMDGILQEVVS